MSEHMEFSVRKVMHLAKLGLVEILDKHFEKPHASLFATAVNRFAGLRAEFRWRKAPGTSELIDWVKLLEEAMKDGAGLVGRLKETPLPDLPFKEALVKHQADRQVLAKMAEGA